MPKDQFAILRHLARVHETTFVEGGLPSPLQWAFVWDFVTFTFTLVAHIHTGMSEQNGSPGMFGN